MAEKIKSIPLREAYTFGINKGFSEEVACIKSMEIEWDRSYTSSVRKGRIIKLFKDKGVLDEFIDKYWPYGNSDIGINRLRRVLKIADDYEEYLSGDSVEGDLCSLHEEESFEFALESHLRDFLAKDLERIEPGLTIFESNTRKGIEYPVDGGRIDILAVDKNNRFVVVELKLSQGRNKALGQLLYYMGWVDSNLGSAPCRGVIIANEISSELEVAVSRTPDISLYRYKMSFSIEPVSNA